FFMGNTSSVTVQVNDDTPIRIELPLEKKLTEIRKILSDKPDIRMGHKVDFIDLSTKCNPKIPYENEEKYNLRNILGKDNSLKISGNIEPDWIEIIENNSLEYGIFFTKDGPKHVEEKKAFKILRHPKSTLRNPITLNEEKACKTEIDEIYLKNLVVKTNLHSIATIDGSYISTSEIHRNNAKFDSYCTSVRINAVFNMTKTEIEPTDEFVSAVDAALRSPDRCQSLKQVTEEFGEYWCEQAKIGGSILYVSRKESGVREVIGAEEQNASAALKLADTTAIEGRIGTNQGKKISNSREKEYSFIKIRGGSETKFYEEGFAEWLKSLKNYDKWRVVEYSETHSIFDILDKDRQAEVAKGFQKQIVGSKVININFEMDLSTPKPHQYSYEFPKNIDLSNTQIFITEMNDNKSDTIFASRVHYYARKETPVILLHRLGKLKKQPTIRRFSVKLGFILIGTTNRLNLIERNSSQLEFENGTALITPNTSLLATFVSKSNDNPDNSKHIARAHFVNQNDSINACAFYYNLESRQLDYRLENMEFSINYSIISGQEKTAKFGRAQIKNKFIKSMSRRLTRSKRFEVIFDDYHKLQFVNERKPCLKNPIFVNLLLRKCPENCPHGVFNITLDHAAFKTIIDSSGLQSAQIAYFSVQTFKDNEERESSL
ncbi:3464_t:CDS:2, partial [Ambispora gerdemannii]